MVKILLLIVLLMPASAFAGTKYCYLGSAFIISAKSTKSGYQTSLMVDSLLYPDLETSQLQLKHNGIGLGYQIEASFQYPVKTGQKIFFNTKYTCWKNGCDKKVWKLLTKEEASNWQGFCARE